MSKSISSLNIEWRALRKKMKENRKDFDDIWREENKKHNCDTKVYSENGEWFCKHITKARNKHFKEESRRIEEIICSIIS